MAIPPPVAVRTSRRRIEDNRRGRRCQQPLAVIDRRGRRSRRVAPLSIAVGDVHGAWHLYLSPRATFTARGTPVAQLGHGCAAPWALWYGVTACTAVALAAAGGVWRADTGSRPLKGRRAAGDSRAVRAAEAVP